MLEEFESEEAGGNPYRGTVLSQAGVAAFPSLMRDAIRSGDEQTLTAALGDPQYWRHTDSVGKTVNFLAAAERLGLTEFNTWYVRGFAKRLMGRAKLNARFTEPGLP